MPPNKGWTIDGESKANAANHWPFAGKFPAGFHVPRPWERERVAKPGEGYRGKHSFVEGQGEVRVNLPFFLHPSAFPLYPPRPAQR